MNDDIALLSIGFMAGVVVGAILAASALYVAVRYR